MQVTCPNIAVHAVSKQVCNSLSPLPYCLYSLFPAVYFRVVTFSAGDLHVFTPGLTENAGRLQFSDSI